MERIIGRDMYEGKYADEYEVILRDLGHGQKEASISRSVWWEHTGTMTDAAYAQYLDTLEAWKASPAGIEAAQEREQRNRERSARRAKAKVRRICKSMGVDSLLTLTYRENMQDLEACKKHLKEFVRRVRKLVPGFAYVAAFERQKRGAWHVHLAIHSLPFSLPWAGVKVKSYSVIRAIWLRVVGDLGGNIDQSRRKRNSRKTPAKIAAYVSKYILKAFEQGEDHSNRYSSSTYSIPDAVRIRLQGAALSDIIALVYLHLGQDGTLTNPWMNAWGDRFFLTAEPDPGWKH